MANEKKRIFIDGQEYASLDQVPPHLKDRVNQQLQGIEAAKVDPSTFRRRMSLGAKGAGGRGEGPSSAPLLFVSGGAFLLLCLLLYLIGR